MLLEHTIQSHRDSWGMAKIRLVCFKIGLGNESQKSVEVNLISNITVMPSRVK